MRAFGMIPVLPAFSGHVPNAITRVFPSANVSQMENWADFSPEYCCTLLLDVEDPLYTTFGQAFIQEYTAEFGTDHIYNTDTFNENRPASNNTEYLKRAGRAVFDAMLAGDP
jgi:alpha-N-acetylglucosaminidase